MFQEQFDYINLVGGLCLLGWVIALAVVITLRDILKVWTCFGMTTARPRAMPTRALTAMSAAYIGAETGGINA